MNQYGLRTVFPCYSQVLASPSLHINEQDKQLTSLVNQPLKDGARGRYSHFPNHKRPSRTPRVNFIYLQE